MLSKEVVECFDSLRRLTRLVVASHAEIGVFYTHTEKLEQIYLILYQNLDKVNVDFVDQAFVFYTQNHFNMLLFTIDRIHELVIKTDACAVATDQLNLLLVESRILDDGKQSCSSADLIKRVTTSQFPFTKAGSIKSDCNEWLRGTKNMLRSMFFTARYDGRFISWKVLSFAHKTEKIEVALTKLGSLHLLDRTNSSFDLTEMSSHIRSTFIPEFAGSILVSHAMSLIIAKNLSDSRSFGRNHEAWVSLEATDTQIIMCSIEDNSPGELVAQKRSLDNAFPSRKKQRPCSKTSDDDDDDDEDHEIKTDVSSEFHPLSKSCAAATLSSSSAGAFMSSASCVGLAITPQITDPFKSLFVAAVKDESFILPCDAMSPFRRLV
jgi:hypothetical protein